MGRWKRIHPQVVFKGRKVDQGFAVHFVAGHSVAKVLHGLRGGAANQVAQRFGPFALGFG